MSCKNRELDVIRLYCAVGGVFASLILYLVSQHYTYLDPWWVAPLILGLVLAVAGHWLRREYAPKGVPKT